jgi:hypothetical protein
MVLRWLEATGRAIGHGELRISRGPFFAKNPFLSKIGEKTSVALRPLSAIFPCYLLLFPCY